MVLVVDEAQNLSPDVLEQVRLLTNLETNTQKLLQIILIGQPELRDLLARNELRQLAQRVTGRYHLNPLSRDETTAYVRHRLRVAGATTDIFSPQALSEVFRLSQGVPRVINVICDRALLGAYSLDRHRVTAALVRHAAAEVFGRRFTPHWLPWALTAGVAALLTGGLVALWNFEPWNHRAVAHSERSSPGDAVAAVPAEKLPAPAAAPVAAAAAPAASHLTRAARAAQGRDRHRQRVRQALQPLGREVPAEHHRPVHAGGAAGTGVRLRARLLRAAAPLQPPGDPAAERWRRESPGGAHLPR